MSFYNTTKNPFPFYPLEGTVWTNTKPLWFRNNCKFQYQKHIIFHGKRYFQLRVSDNLQMQGDITSVVLRRVSDNVVMAADNSHTLYVDNKLNRKYVVIEMDIPSGYIDADYYVAVETDYGYYYSEPFCVKNPDTDLIGITWASSKGKVGDMVYPENFRHFVNIEANILPGEYQIEEDTSENGFGEEIPDLQVLRQPYTFSFMAPNFLAQAFSALRLHDKIQILNRPKGDYDEAFDENIKNVQVTITSEEDGCFSLVEVSYQEETIITTACEDEILPANNPPQADIVWNDTQTTEDRVCNVQETCQQTVLITEFTYDPDDNMDHTEWERSSDYGATWVSLGNSVGDTKIFNEPTEGHYWYRLKAIDTYGAIGYSNILKYEVYDYASFSNLATSAIRTCELLGDAKDFDIVGDVSQNAKIQFKVLSTYGRGFYLKLYNRDDDSLLLTWFGGPAGTTTDKIVTLDGAGLGRYRVEMCLNSCNGDIYIQSTVELRLYKDDNTTLGDSHFNLVKFYQC
ncbi:hypothetical protein C7S20_00010 [Christiangramia fulva]|uniref:Uncharacterized protein n=1 Tax=Christiangramia fulva TaxID=2126553 RepID=A0A2R3Z0J1_9FLAO|nr:hypothetical protein [Christiangramia fulva]AVR43782.1 hypothetical protein C7S20_00010 [Christiangramia fulva]